jgi:hypothetical protein
MMVRLGLFWAMAGGALWGCQAAPREGEAVASAPLFFVPGAMMVDGGPGQRGAGINPFQVLPASEAEDDFIGRSEKFVYGSVMVEGYTAYSIYTYDVQQIGSPWGFGGVGYRYTYSVREGASFP